MRHKEEGAWEYYNPDNWGLLEGLNNANVVGELIGDLVLEVMEERVFMTGIGRIEWRW